jgi:large subunit ribosomal protein L19e
MNLKNQRRMAAELLGCGNNRVWIDPNRIEDVADAITRADIRTAIDSGTIRALPKRGTSKARTRYAHDQKSKGRRKGAGSRKGSVGARNPKKKRWIRTIRPIRDELKSLRDEGNITPSIYREFYLKAKGGMFKSRNHLVSHLVSEGHLREGN